jgi:hypothetical protein
MPGLLNLPAGPQGRIRPAGHVSQLLRTGRLGWRRLWLGRPEIWIGINEGFGRITHPVKTGSKTSLLRD